MLPLLLVLTGCDAIRATLITTFSPEYEAEGSGTARAGTGPTAVFDKLDAERERLNIRLRPVADGFTEPVDIQFPPGESERMVVVEKGGSAWLLTGEGFAERSRFLSLEVLTSSEQGLLGVAFHPSFSDNGRFYTNATVDHPQGAHTQITEWTVEPSAAQWRPERGGEVLAVRQPYGNHNAGQLAFGPDGYLYIGLGDGGWADDPEGNGQNGQTLLGSMLRIDVDGARPYAIPPDNPFVGNPQVRDEAFAIGLRNPWRYSFSPDGRLIVADVGQNTAEEIHIVAAGDNLGWAQREGRGCFPVEVTDCTTEGLVEPIYTYGRKDGGSITGGYVVTDAAAGGLAGRYVFGDFASGRLWALTLPDAVRVGDPEVSAYSLGRWGVLLSAFGQDGWGRLYLADYASGSIYRVEG